MLVHQYEIFKMLEHENINEMTTRFMHIVNQVTEKNIGTTKG